MNSSLHSQKAKFDAFVDEKYIKLENNKKIAIAVALFLLPALLFYFMAFMPNEEQIASLENNVKEAQQDLARAELASRDLPRHQKELEDLKNKFELTAILLPKTQEIPNLLRNISDLGRSSGLEFLVFSPGAETPQDFYAEIPINITIKGPYHALGSFLDQVSKLERIVTVNNITMDNPTPDGGETSLSSNCTLITYRFTNQQLPKDGAQK